MEAMLPVELPTAENFAAFGVVLSTEGTQPTLVEKEYNFRPALCVLEGEGYAVNLLTCKKRELTIDRVERHLRTKEILIALDTQGLIVVVAPPGEHWEESDLRAFYMAPGTGLALEEGVRHFLPYPIARDTDCVVLYRKGTEQTDLTFEPLSKSYGFVL